MLILVQDTETTGVDRAKDYVTEFAAALYSTEHKSILWLGSTLLPAPADAIRSTTEITGIGPEEVQLLTAMDAGSDVVESTLSMVNRLAKIVRVQVAHNAEFDKPFVYRTYQALGLDLPQTPWVCTVEDIEFPRRSPSHKLAHMALDNGIIATGWHRAYNDVVLLCKMLGTVADLDAQIEIALGPRAKFIAIVPYEKRDLAKLAGFRWDPDRKQWWKRLPLDTPTERTADRPFGLARLKE